MATVSVKIASARRNGSLLALVVERRAVDTDPDPTYTVVMEIPDTLTPLQARTFITAAIQAREAQMTLDAAAASATATKLLSYVGTVFAVTV